MNGKSLIYYGYIKIKIDILILKIQDNLRKLKEHFGYSVPPYPEELLIMPGYMNMDMNQPEKAKTYFELAIEYYPKSANTYDSMADYYERNNDYSNALKFVTKAFEISNDDYHKERIEALKNR